MRMPEKSGKIVIIGVDESNTSENAFHVYAQKVHEPGNVVLVIHSIEVHSPHIYNSIFVRPEIEQAEFEKECERTRNVELKYNGLMQKYMMAGEYLSVAGKPGETLCRLVKDYKAGLIVMGSHNKGLMARTLLGSVSHYVSHHASCEVVTIKKTHSVY